MVAHHVTHARGQVAAQLDVTELVVVPLHLVKLGGEQYAVRNEQYAVSSEQ